jgi:hypothetical protein
VFRIQLDFEFHPIGSCQAREAINLLDKEDVVLMGVCQKME